MNQTRTVGEVGEKELIRLLEPWVFCGAGDGGVLGVGDDCAVLHQQPSGARSIITTDLLVEGTHFLWHEGTNWDWVGRKAAGANISDIAAMGSKPVAMFVSLAVPAHFKVQDVLALYRGLHWVAEQYEIQISGGDTTRSDRATISITVAGIKERDRAECRRSDARPGDFIYVSGDLGGSRAGLELMLRPEAQMLVSPELSSALVERHFTPTPPVDLGLALAKLYPRVAAIDISDGLYNDARLLAEASAAELEIHLEAIPLHTGAEALCAKTGKDPATFALFSGEEYQLLFALPMAPNHLFEDLRHSGVECAVTLVGTVNSGSGLRLLKDGHPVDPKDETFVHFP